MLTSSVVRVCLYMMQDKRVWIPLTMLSQSVTFLASLKIWPGSPLTYGLDCFVSSRVGTSYPFGTSAFIPVLVGLLFLDLLFYVYGLSIVVCPFVRFRVPIVLFFSMDLRILITHLVSLNSFLFNNFKSRLSFLISVIRVKHYC